MRTRPVISLGVALAFGLLDQGAHAASYQKTDGTLVDPIGRTTAAMPSFHAAFNNCRRDMAPSARS